MPVVANVRQFAMVFDWQGQPAVNVYHIKRATGWDGVEEFTRASSLRDWWESSIKPEVSTACSLVQIKIRDLEPANQPTYIYESGLPIAGDSSATPAPTNVTACVTWRTDLSGRSYRGRTYHVGITTTKFSLSRLTTVVQGEMIDMYTALITAVEATAGDTLCIVSYRSGGQLRDTPLSTDVTSCYVDRNLDSMRRRLPGRGPTA